MNRFAAAVWASIALAIGPLSAGMASAQVRVSVEAYEGQPFGVARLTAALPADMLPEPLGIDGLGIAEKDGRALFPATSAPILGDVARGILDQTPLLRGGPVRQEIRGILRGALDRPPAATVYFLFRGDQPLELRLLARDELPVRAVPRTDAEMHGRLLAAWWAEYTRPPRLLERKPDYPPLVENYLKATLARRLNLKLPEREQTESPRELLKEELGLLSGSEKVRLAMEQDRLLMLHELGQPADRPVPEVREPPPLEVPAADGAAIEPLAERVPEECFYVRFGGYSNFLWLQDMLATWGGDLQNLVAARGLDYGLSRLIERQLVLKASELSRYVGDMVIADVALIGTDTFFREGASYGILFQARNNTVLGADILRQRLARVTAGGVEEQKVRIGDREVSYLSAPDGSVRSYYVVDGDYHLVTTSKTLAARFLETAGGAGSLARSGDFRHARTLMPLSRGDTVWVFLSDAFFRHLTGPRYRTEMIRRLQATADIEVVQLAVLAAAAEGKPAETIDQLIAGALLPPDFGPRPDGSRTVLAGGEAHDSLRGRRGALVPAADVPVERLTRAEAAQYARFAEFYRREWGRMDPTIIALRRQPVGPRKERIVLDAQLSPFAAEHFKFLSRWAGAPQTQRIAPVEGDVARLELVMPNQHVFAGLRDFGPPAGMSLASLVPAGPYRDLLVGYIGTTGELGFLSFLEGPIVVAPGIRVEAAPLTPLKQQAGQFTVFSLHPDVLAEVVPQLHFEEAPRPAQLRAEIKDLSQARIAPVVNNWGYRRTRETSLGNLRLLAAMDQQLHVAPADCRRQAERLLGAELLCPLGGRYVLSDPPGKPARWTSTALDGAPQTPLLGGRAPEGYRAPPLDWFRGLELEATMTRSTLTAHADLVMQMPEKPKPGEKASP